MKTTANLFCEYLQLVKPEALQIALDKFQGEKIKGKDEVKYIFPDGSFAVMYRSRPGIIIASDR